MEAETGVDGLAKEPTAHGSTHYYLPLHATLHVLVPRSLLAPTDPNHTHDAHVK
jgi:hypothetical protein